jgi:hypothetical protein
MQMWQLQLHVVTFKIMCVENATKMSPLEHAGGGNAGECC